MDPAYSLRVTARPIGQFSSRIEFALFGYNLLLVFPSGCSSYRGAKNLACLRRIWLEAGCAEEGFASPENMTQDQLLAMSSFNLRYLKYFSTSNNIVVIIAINDMFSKKQMLYSNEDSIGKNILLIVTLKKRRYFKDFSNHYELFLIVTLGKTRIF